MSDSRTTKTDHRVSINGYVTWKWALGALLAMGASSAGAYAAVKSDVAVLQQRFIDFERDQVYRNTLQDGRNDRYERGFKDVREAFHRVELRQVAFEARVGVPPSRRIPVPPAPRPLPAEAP